MLSSSALTLSKEERLSSRKLIDKLFNESGSRSMSAFPLRVVYRLEESDNDVPQARILVSVPKRCFKHAVDRNRVKRQVREAYRRNKNILPRIDGKCLLIAFIWLDGKHYSSAEVEHRILRLLGRIIDKYETVDSIG